MSPIFLARRHAEAGRFDQFLSLCLHIAGFSPSDPLVQRDVGALLLTYGFLSHAESCLHRAKVLARNDLQTVVNFANIFRDRGEHTEVLHLYDELLDRLPDHPVIRRNALTSAEYDPTVSDDERLAQAKEWGEWAKSRAHRAETRPQAEASKPDPKSHEDRQLRVGFVSPDFCQHTVGLLVKDTLKAFNRSRVEPTLYHAGTVNDWVTEELRSCFTLRDVSSLDDAALAALVQQDGIDVLVDLSGHTAGSRLTAFAYRPAPVQVSRTQSPSPTPPHPATQRA